MTDTKENLPYRPNVGIMLLNPAGYVFVGQRRDSEFDAWQMPQGGIDPGEDVESAGFRELEEETGVRREHATLIAKTSEPVRYDLPDDLLKTLWNGRFRGQEQTWLLMRFTGKDADINIFTEHPEFSEWKWMVPKDLTSQIVPFKKAVYQAVLEAFEEYL